MKVCVVGAGAIGGLIAAKLALAGRCDVSVVARANTARALRNHGLRLKSSGEVNTAHVHVEEHPSALGVQDIVFVAVKGPSMTSVAATIAPLIGPRTMIVPAMNGVPWWFAQVIPALQDQPLVSVDPTGSIAAAIPANQILGCVVHASASTPEPGFVDHKFGLGLIIGEANGSVSERAAAVVQLLKHAGFEVALSSNVVQDIWFKLWGNLTMNPVSAITGATVDRILADPLVRNFCSAAMEEASLVGRQIGLTINLTPDARHDVTMKLGAFRTSMLQDAEAGREIELDGIVGAVQEIARRLNVPTPNIDALLGLARLFGRVHGLYQEAHR
jgi:2-dehydropantoate 2-reductase